MLYDVNNNFLSVNAAKIYQFKKKGSEMKIYTLCLGNISGNCSANNMKITGLNRCVYDFSVDYRAFDTNNIIDIHKYLIENHNTQ